MSNARGEIGCEADPSRLKITRNQRFQTGFVNRQAAVVEQLDLACIYIYAEHLIAAFREACTGHQAYITSADDRDFHALTGERSKEAYINYSQAHLLGYGGFRARRICILSSRL